MFMAPLSGSLAVLQTYFTLKMRQASPYSVQLGGSFFATLSIQVINGSRRIRIRLC
jgi:hypothetical protein